MTTPEPPRPPRNPPPVLEPVYGEDGELIGWNDPATGTFIPVDKPEAEGVASEA